MKAIGFSCLAFALFLSASNVFSADVLDNSLILRFDFTSEPVNDVITDTSPAGGHPGTNLAATWAASEDEREGVMSFDGTFPSQITVASASDLNSSTGAITFWMKSSLVTPDPNPYAIIFDRRETPGAGGEVFYQTENGRLNTQAEATGRAGANARVTSGSVTDGEWRHIAYVYDQRASGSVSVYVDGVLDATGVNTRAWSWVEGQEIALGKSADPFWSGFTGFLDDFRIYNRILTASEVASIAGLAPTPQIVLNSSGQPQSITVAEKDTPAFTVRATIVNGDPGQLRYQWQKDGVDIPNATNAAYSLTATAADSGGKFRAILSAPGTTNVTSQEATLTVVPEMALIYSFETEPVNDEIIDSSTNAVKHPGLNLGATWVASEEERNGVMNFDGAIPSQITIAPAPELSSTRGTIAFWMKSAVVTPDPNPYAIILDRRETPGAGGDVIFQGPDGTLNNQAEGAGRAAVNSQTTSGSLTDGKWHHFAYLYDQTAGGTVSFYVDGLLNSIETNSGAWTWNPDLPIEIGKSHDPFWSGYSGFLDEFRIHNRVLSAAELAALAGLGTGPQIVITRQPPASLTVATGDTPVLSVSATVANGDPSALQYQWQKDGVDIQSATNAAYTLTAATADTGRRFRARLTAGGAAAVNSDEVALTVVPEVIVIYNFDAAPVNDEILDSSPNATKHNGLNLGATWIESESGRTGVMSFDGAIPSQITIAPAPELNSTRGTIAFWMKSPIVTPDPNPYAIIFDRRETGGAGGDVLYQAPEGTLANQAEGAGRSRANEQTTTLSLTDTNWHHFAYLYDQTAGGSVSFYVDGVLNTTRTNSGAWSWNPDQQIEIGESHDTFWSGFTGVLDEFRLYNRVLSPAEISALSGAAAQPTVSIQRDGNQITVSWDSSDFVLQSNSNLGNPGGWIDVPGNPGSPFVLPLPVTGASFYRLRK